MFEVFVRASDSIGKLFEEIFLSYQKCSIMTVFMIYI